MNRKTLLMLMLFLATATFAWPVGFPGHPSGSRPGGSGSQAQMAVSLSFAGPVCFPGDPCGSSPGGKGSKVQLALNLGFAGPVCFPGDPCGSKPVVAKSRGLAI
jgi:hypothetical protein